jgi:hypothetical protein
MTRLDLTRFLVFVPVPIVVLLPPAAALAKQLTVLRLLFTYSYIYCRAARVGALRCCERFGDVVKSLPALNLDEGCFYLRVYVWPQLEALDLQCNAPLTAAAVRDAGNMCRRLRELRLDAARYSLGGLGVGQHKLFCGQQKLFPHLETLWLKSAANEKRARGQFPT